VYIDVVPHFGAPTMKKSGRRPLERGGVELIAGR
jgi:hypothetical protein